MIAYEFLDLDTDERVTVLYEHANAPSIGKVIRRGGRRLRRLPSLPQAKVKPNFHFKSRQLPKWWPYHKGAYAADGACLIDSTERGIKDGVKRARDDGEPVDWD